MRSARMLTVAMVVAAVLIQATGAWAAPPSNDTIGGAIAITSIPYTNTQDTTEATTDADDEALNANCGAPATDASVWYTIVGSGIDLFVDFSGSDYSGGILVGSGSPGSLELVACGQFGTGFFAEDGVTYYILAIDDQLDSDGRNGGQMVLSVDTPPPPPEITLTVDRNGRVDPKTGGASISGTATCVGENVDFSEIYGELSQRAGRVTIRGFFFSGMTCDGEAHPWTAEVTADNGRFAGGKATVNVTAFACNVFNCGEANVQQTVNLKGGSR